MKIIEKRLDEIRPYDNNPRVNDAAVPATANSIKEYGWQQPIVIDRDGVIVCGHTRYKAALKLGLETVPCKYADELTPEQVDAYRLADNKTGELATWDDEKLMQELAKCADFDMSAFGFDETEEPEDPDDVIEDEAPEPPEEPKSKYGEVYQLGKHRLMCGDSTKLEDVKKLMGDDMADMVFTDPPWNVNYGSDSDHPSWKPRQIMNDFMGTEEFKEFMFSAFKCMNEVSKAGACTYVVMSAQEWGNMMLTLAQNDYHWSSTIIWNKDRLVLSRKDYHTKYEPIWYGWKAGSRLCPLKDRKQSDVWDFDRPTKSEEHPTMKPVGLVARAVQNSSKRDNLVLDLFGGSGTTLIACEQTGRSCCIMELDPHYCDVIINRWETFTGKKAEVIND